MTNKGQQKTTTETPKRKKKKKVLKNSIMFDELVFCYSISIEFKWECCCLAKVGVQKCARGFLNHF